MTPMPHPSYSADLTVSSFLFCLFPGMKKVLKGKHFADVEEVKQKTIEAPKGINIDKFKNFWAVEKSLDRCFGPDGEYFEGDWSLNM